MNPATSFSLFFVAVLVVVLLFLFSCSDFLVVVVVVVVVAAAAVEVVVVSLYEFMISGNTDDFRWIRVTGTLLSPPGIFEIFLSFLFVWSKWPHFLL